MAEPLVPPTLPIVAAAGRRSDGRSWLRDLPALVETVRRAWSLEIMPPYEEGTRAWIAPVILPGGESAVLKLPWPHREAPGEAEALRRWDGYGAVRLLRHDPHRHALLLEPCDPGTRLGAAHRTPAVARLTAATEVLRQLWSAPLPEPGTTGLESLVDVAAGWGDLLDERAGRIDTGYDPGLVAHTSKMLRDLPATASRTVILHGDFTAGTVLASARQPWLAIDPKPIIGDPAYDPWPLLEEIDDPFGYPRPGRMLADRTRLVADATGEDVERILAWSVTRRVNTALRLADRGDVPGGAYVMCQARTLADLLGI